MRRLFFLLALFTGAALHASEPLSPAQQRWVDSVMATLSLDEKIGQMFMVPAWSREGAAHQADLMRQMKDHHIGGVIFMQGGPVRQLRMTNALQKASRFPLLISQDAEWGLDMRLDSCPQFPRQLTLGAIMNHHLVEEMGAEIARQCKLLGVHMSLSPVVDINSNPNNPVIGDRSFGSNKYRVALRGLQYANGLQNHGVLACAKHFPGHGDTDKDSHHALPIIKHKRKRLDTMELFPFRILIENNVAAIMSAHLHIPDLDPTPDRASSLSPMIIEELLRKEMGFEGLIVSDALNMKGVSGFNEPGQAELLAYLAGNDILLFPADMAKARIAIRKAIANGLSSETELDKRVRRILVAKAKAGLHRYKPADERNLMDRLNSPAAASLIRKLYSEALTLVRNSDKAIPLNPASDDEVAVLTVGGRKNSAMVDRMQAFRKVSHFVTTSNPDASIRRQLRTRLSTMDMVVVAIHDISRHRRKRHNISKELLELLEGLNEDTKVVVVLYGSPYALIYFEDFYRVMVAYEDRPEIHDLVGQALFGALPVRGELPVQVSDGYPYGTARILPRAIRLGYADPGDVGLDKDMLDAGIAKIAKEGLGMRAFPGCQVLVARHGQIVYHKTFGYHTYKGRRPVRTTDVYDLASITKIAATTISLMALYDDGLWEPGDRMQDHLPALRGSPIGKCTVRDVMMHQAGLKAWIPFYQRTLEDTSSPPIYSQTQNAAYNIQVAKDLFIRSDYPDTIRRIIRETPLSNPGDYRYSDLGYITFADFIEAKAGMPLDEFVQKRFYQKMGLANIGYRPLTWTGVDNIVPTEDDKTFRRQVLQGHVHDPAAAMMGGVSGHAGLFGTAPDLAAVMQMLLNHGSYAGHDLIAPPTVQYFVQERSGKSRRGLGFDRPSIDKSYSPCCSLATPNTFGHNGFTGTCTWVDPDKDLIYIFLSNRIHPKQDNKHLAREDIRERIQQVIYESMMHYHP